MSTTPKHTLTPSERLVLESWYHNRALDYIANKQLQQLALRDETTLKQWREDMKAKRAT